MEKSVEKSEQFFASLPVGYMVPFDGVDLPENFIEVDSQTLDKSQFMDLFRLISKIVVDNTDSFVLPNKNQIRNFFKNNLTKDTKIILKIK